MLVYDRHIPDLARDGSPVAVLLHGRGSHRGDLQALRDRLPADMILVTPQAPHPGQPWGYGPGWAWYRYEGEDRVGPEGLERSLASLDRFMGSLATELPFAPGDVVLGGFSQGGTTSLAYALKHPERVSAVLVFSGFLVNDEVLSVDTDASEAPPVFWGHGLRDPNIPHALGESGRERLRARGVELDARDYDIGHWIAPEELSDAFGWIEERIDRR